MVLTICKQCSSFLLLLCLLILHASHGKEYQEVNLDKLQHWIETGRIDPSQPITMKHLLDSRCIHKIEDGVKLLSVVSCHYIHFSTCNSFLF